MALDGLRPRDRVFVEYSDPADKRLHERLILSLPSCSELCCCTPHYDVYVEDISSWSAIYRSGPRQGTPSAWYKRNGTRRIVKFDLEELEGRTAALLEEAETEAPSTVSMVHVDGRHDPTLSLDAEGEDSAHVDSRQPLLAKRGGGKVPTNPSGGPPGHLDHRAENAQRSKGGYEGADEEAIWVAIERRGGLNVGEPIPDEGRLAKSGDRGIFEFGGTFIAVAKQGTYNVPAQSRKVLEIDPSFRRGRPNFTDLVEHLSTSGGDFKGIDGPRTCEWLLQQFEARDTTPVTRHWWWRSTLGLGSGQFGVDWHLSASRILEAGVVQDRLNITDLHSFELVARDYQIIERHYGETLQNTMAPQTGPGWLSPEEADMFRGSRSSQTIALVCPSLEKYVSGELAASSSLLKERRKAREEHNLWAASRNPPTGPKTPAPKSAQPKTKGKG